MTAINGANLLGFYAEKSATVHNCPRWVASHIMNMEKN